MLVVDASVLVKAIVREQDSDEAKRLLAGRQDLVAPAHCLAEVGETTAKKVRGGQALIEQVESALTALLDSIDFISLNRLIVPATRICLRTGASVYDCLYVALAASEDCPLVTADRRLIAKMAETEFAALMTPLESFNAAP